MLCRLAEAKFLAEREKDVGENSAIGAVNGPIDVVTGTSERFVSIGAINAIRTANSQLQNRPYPKALLQLIMNELDAMITSENMSAAIRLARYILERRRRNKRKQAN